MNYTGFRCAWANTAEVDNKKKRVNILHTVQDIYTGWLKSVFFNFFVKAGTANP